jgi:hypothetical protein
MIIEFKWSLFGNLTAGSAFRASHRIADQHSLRNTRSPPSTASDAGCK